MPSASDYKKLRKIPLRKSEGDLFWSQIMKYPLYIDGKPKGTLTVTQEKLHLVFHAECEYTQRLIRLSVFGNGKSAYLGVMEPKNNKLVLCRRKSRSELKNFPTPIEYAADRELIADKKSDDTVWYEAPNGTLSTKGLIAIPSDIRHPKNCDIRRINGREYVVFPSEIKSWKKDR